MTISDKLALLEQTKEAQRVKLGLPESLPFNQYIKFIRDPFTINELFESGEQGIWLDPSDLSTMFQDVNGLEPVTKNGDPIALIKDKSGNGNHAIQETATSRPVYRTDGNLHWIDFDGVDDYLIVTDVNKHLNKGSLTTAIKVISSGNYARILVPEDGGSTGSLYTIHSQGSGTYFRVGSEIVRHELDIRTSVEWIVSVLDSNKNTVTIYDAINGQSNYTLPQIGNEALEGSMSIGHPTDVVSYQLRGRLYNLLIVNKPLGHNVVSNVVEKFWGEND